MVRRIARADLTVIVLLTVITALFGWQYVERRHRLAENHRAICAIRAYIEGQYLITATIAHTPQRVIVARRKVIQEFEDRMDGNCK